MKISIKALVLLNIISFSFSLSLVAEKFPEVRGKKQKKNTPRDRIMKASDLPACPPDSNTGTSVEESNDNLRTKSITITPDSLVDAQINENVPTSDLLQDDNSTNPVSESGTLADVDTSIAATLHIRAVPSADCTNDAIVIDDSNALNICRTGHRLVRDESTGNGASIIDDVDIEKTVYVCKTWHIFTKDDNTGAGNDEPIVDGGVDIEKH